VRNLTNYCISVDRWNEMAYQQPSFYILLSSNFIRAVRVFLSHCSMAP